MCFLAIPLVISLLFQSNRRDLYQLLWVALAPLLYYTSSSYPLLISSYSWMVRVSAPLYCALEAFCVVVASERLNSYLNRTITGGDTDASTRAKYIVLGISFFMFTLWYEWNRCHLFDAVLYHRHRHYRRHQLHLNPQPPCPSQPFIYLPRHTHHNTIYEVMCPGSNHTLCLQ